MRSEATFFVVLAILFMYLADACARSDVDAGAGMGSLQDFAPHKIGDSYKARNTDAHTTCTHGTIEHRRRCWANLPTAE